METIKRELPETFATKPTFLTLPSEIRLMILKHVFSVCDLSYTLCMPEKRGTSQMMSKRGNTRKSNVHLAVALTCRLLHQEGIEMYRRMSTYTCNTKQIDFPRFVNQMSAEVRSRVVHFDCVYLPPMYLMTSLIKFERLRSVHFFVLINEVENANQGIYREPWLKTRVRDASPWQFEALLAAHEFNVGQFKCLRSRKDFEFTVGFEVPYQTSRNSRVRLVPCLYDLKRRVVHRYWKQNEYPRSLTYYHGRKCEVNLNEKEE